MPKEIKKGKKPHKNKPTSKKYTKYKIISNAGGTKVAREQFCPRCGPGIFLMKTQDRVYCGKCHYTSFESKETVGKKS